MPHSAARLLAALDPNAGVPTDTDLLTRFATERDAGAFELLVWRHAALVLRVCRGVLLDHHAAEDAAWLQFPSAGPTGRLSRAHRLRGGVAVPGGPTDRGPSGPSARSADRPAHRS